jgi:hypothetical protein
MGSKQKKTDSLMIQGDRQPKCSFKMMLKVLFLNEITHPKE